MRPLPNGGAVILIEDERNVAGMSRSPGLSTVVAIARVLNARRLLDVKFKNKGEVRYCSSATLPSFLFEAVSRAGAAIADRAGDNIVLPPNPASVASVVDTAFSELAHTTRVISGANDMTTALQRTEANRRKSPIDKEANPALYWTAVFELASLAGELSRPRGGRWIDTHDTPVPFAIKFAEGSELARPAKLAIQIVEGEAAEASMVSETLTPGS